MPKITHVTTNGSEITTTEFDVASIKIEQRAFVCTTNIEKHLGNAVTIMGRIVSKIDDTRISINDSTGEIQLVAERADFFDTLAVNEIIQVEGYANTKTEIQVAEIEIMADANNDALNLRAKTACLCDKWSGVIYGN